LARIGTSDFSCDCDNLLNFQSLCCLVGTQDQYTTMASKYSMPTLKPAKSGARKLRKRLPADVRVEYQSLYGPAWEEKLTIPASTPPEKAKAEYAAWLAKVEGRIGALRASKGGKGTDITQRQADALAGDWYRWYIAQHEENPGSPDGYGAWRRTRATLGPVKLISMIQRW
jgi:hypothetical protein